MGHALLVHGGRHCAPGKTDRVLDDVALLDVSDPDRPVWCDVVSEGDRPSGHYGHCSAVTQNGDGSGWTVYFFGGRALHSGLRASLAHDREPPPPLDQASVEPADPQALEAAEAAEAEAVEAVEDVEAAVRGEAGSREASEGAVEREEEAAEAEEAEEEAAEAEGTAMRTQASMEFGANPLESHGVAALYLDNAVTVGPS